MSFKKSIAALAVAGAIVAGMVGVSASAQAAAIPGTITLTPTSGNVSDTYFINSIGVSVGAVAPHNLASGTFAYQNGVEMGSLANMRTPGNVPSTAGNSGLNGAPAYLHRSTSPTNDFVSNKQLSALSTPLVSGDWELRFYYFASNTAPNRATDPYISLPMTFDAATGAWAVYTAPVAAIVTTTSLTAATTANAGEINLSATVKDGAATATAAAGDIVFKEGTTTVATVPVAGGSASALLTGVADGPHSYTAEFVSSDAVYSGSVSGAATVNVGSPAPQDVTVNVTILGGAGALTLTGVSNSVNLGTAVLAGGTLNATGTLNAIVTDTRQLEYPAWNLTGQVGNFTSGSTVLDGKYLGWTPTASGLSNSVAGAEVVPAGSTGNGLKTSSVLVSGAPSADGSVTNASAALLLKAPSNTPAGAYSATLTLTLI